MTAGPHRKRLIEARGHRTRSWRLSGRVLAGLGLPGAVSLLFVLCALHGAVGASAADDEEPGGDKPGTGAPLRETPAAPSKDPLAIGVFPVSAKSITDGDTLRTTGAKASVRILSLDTEEVFKSKRDRADAEADFAAYARAKRGERARPVKYGTPAGEAAKTFALGLLEGVTHVRLERDAVGAPEYGTYGRLLAHVILLKPDGREVNFSEAIIRAGHSPYFIKYGGSARFDVLYKAAEAEAQKAKRGIWGDDGPEHYPDYPERCSWWRERLAQANHWKKNHAAKPDHVTLGSPGSDKQLQGLLGKEATVFGVLRRVLEGAAKDRHIFLLGSTGRKTFGVVLFDEQAFESIDTQALDGMYVTARGPISLYRKDRPQMVIEKADQISVAAK